MSEWIKQLFVSIFGAHSDIATFLISMVPIVELRGAIPFGSATSFWGESALPLWQSFLIAVLGSSLVCVILTFIFWPIFNWLKRTKWFNKLAICIENKLKSNSEGINNKTSKEKNKKRVLLLKLVGVFLFVAIPLPLTGVWTGTCLALFIGLNKKQTIASVILGNLVAGGIMTIISLFFAEDTLVVLLVFLALVLVFVLFEIIKHFIKKHKKGILEKEIQNKKEIEQLKEVEVVSQIKEISEDKKDD